jgi:putative membrane protein
MKRTLLGATSALFLMTGAAFAAPPDQPGHKSPAAGANSETMSRAEDATAGVVGRVSAEMTSTTKGFVTAAATSDMYEVAAGKIAVERAHSPEVKAFAQQMIDAHTKTTNALKAILASDNVQVTPPAHVDNRRQGMLDNLRGASAADFDHRYVTQQVAAHKEADILFRGYAKDGDNAAIKAFAAKTDPTIRMHLSMAQKLDRTITASAK